MTIRLGRHGRPPASKATKGRRAPSVSALTPSPSKAKIFAAGDGVVDDSGARCPCGLRVDKDHRPERCDLAAGVLGIAGSRAGAFGRHRGAAS